MTTIRINLLPVRQVKKREMGRQFLVLVAGALIISGAGNYYWYASRDGVRERHQEQVTETQRRIDTLEKQIGEVNELKKRKKEVVDKLAILDKLKKQRNGPVKMLDALSSAIPKKVFVSDFDEKASAVRIVGTGESHEDVSEFMHGLSNIVWTPKGIGRVVERKRDARTVRIELLSAEGSIEDFEAKDLSNFFTGVELKTSEQFDNKGKPNVKFELGMTANYAT
ncbi:MAG: PilN domain-containing protein [Myxococcus sp.]|nr:PilN domain-containing protein [Myxococcus sp.]